jgi:hypothetical protein
MPEAAPMLALMRRRARKVQATLRRSSLAKAICGFRPNATTARDTSQAAAGDLLALD